MAVLRALPASYRLVHTPPCAYHGPVDTDFSIDSSSDSLARFIVLVAGNNYKAVHSRPHTTFLLCTFITLQLP